MKKIAIVLAASSAPLMASEWSNPDYDNSIKYLSSLGEADLALLAEAPIAYEFKSRFTEGQSSVFYGGQVFRQVLNSDLKSYMGSLTRGGYPGFRDEAELALDSYYSYDPSNGNLFPDVIYGLSEFQVTAKGLSGELLPIAEGQFYDDLGGSGKDLRGKTAGNDNALRRGELKGWSTLVIDGVDVREQDLDGDGIIEPEDLIDTWLKVCALHATESDSFVVDAGAGNVRVDQACTTESGLDLTQLVQKFLHGAVSFSQAAGDYLSVDLGASKGLNADNSVAKGSQLILL